MFLLPELALNRVEGAVYTPNIDHLTSHDLAHEFISRARTRGVKFVTDTEIDLVVEGGCVTGIAHDEGTVNTEEVVACGPWTPKLLQEADVHLPLRHTLAPVIELEPLSRSPHSLPFG